jgi:mono/diheme cytochrome c family protein
MGRDRACDGLPRIVRTPSSRPPSSARVCRRRRCWTLRRRHATAEDATVAGDAERGDAASRRERCRIDDASDAATDDVTRSHARALYDTHCALCHGPDGHGYLADNAPAIAYPDFLRLATDEFLYTAVYDGRPGTPMSAWGVDHGGPFSAADAREVAALIRSWSSVPRTSRRSP